MPRRIVIEGAAHVIVDGERGQTVYDGRTTRVAVTLDAGPPVEFWHSIPAEQWSEMADGTLVVSPAVFRDAGGGSVELLIGTAGGRITGVGWRSGRPG